jgi:hypothetical protein
MMQAMGDGGVHNIVISLSNNKSHKERPWACLDTAYKTPSLFSMAFDKFLIGSMYV